MNNIETRQPNFDKKYTNNGINSNEYQDFRISLDLTGSAEGSTYPAPADANLNTENIPTSSNTLQSTSIPSFVPTPSTSTILCQYFQIGQCRYGPLCRFSHNLELAGTTEEEIVSSSQTDSEDLGGSSTEQIPNAVESVNANNNNNEKIVPSNPASWINAPVFIPKHLSSTSESASLSAQPEPEIENQSKSYAQILSGDDNLHSAYEYVTSELCPYMKGTPALTENNEQTYTCPYGEQCMYQHALLCDMCQNYCLHPTDEEQQKQHRNDCIRQHEKDMELSFAIARSKDKTCGVCFEVIKEKAGREKRFGILPNCNHIFCLECIRKWRQAKQFDNNIIRACPECRVTSDFVCPSLYWVETKEEKDKLIDDYKNALGQQNCKYFKQGSGKCPFGNKCFYKHALPDGKLVDVGMPHREQRRRLNENGETDVFQQFVLWNFLEARENFLISDFISLLSDESDTDSDIFDIEFLNE